MEGDWIFPNGVYWRGKFAKNKPIKNGEWHFSNGNTVKGEFTQTIPEEQAEDQPIQVKINWKTYPEIVDYTR